MTPVLPPIFGLTPALFGRVWGGDRLAALTEATAPEGPVGEAWLVSDRDDVVSVVTDGPRAGATLHDLLLEDPEALLGAGIATTPQGRFPLLLKLLDCHALLSVQVHPDDAAAAALGETDTGKTEMWYVLDATAAGEVLCGLDPKLDRRGFIQAAQTGAIGDAIARWNAAPGMAFFVPAGVVHALGEGLLIAEIQQNSDLTYRVYDWGRTGTDGQPRALHLDKAAQVTTFGAAYPGPVRAETRRKDDAELQRLADCPNFRAESIALNGRYEHATEGVVHLLLATGGQVEVIAEDQRCILHPGRATVVPARVAHFRLEGAGSCLLYSAQRDAT